VPAPTGCSSKAYQPGYRSTELTDTAKKALDKCTLI
jgi:hypothetical protein